jgi:hypothetical protein
MSERSDAREAKEEAVQQAKTDAAEARAEKKAEVESAKVEAAKRHLFRVTHYRRAVAKDGKPDPTTSPEAKVTHVVASTQEAAAAHVRKRLKSPGFEHEVQAVQSERADVQIADEE